MSKQNLIRGKHCFTLLVLILVISLPLSKMLTTPALAQPSTESDNSGLFTPLAMTARQQLPTIQADARVTVERSQLVQLNWEQLGTSAQSSGRAAQSQIKPQLALNLFADVTLTASLERVETNPSGSYAWIGTVAGAPNSLVHLLFKDGQMAGDIRLPSPINSGLPGDVYQIRPTGDGAYWVRKIVIAASALPPHDYLRPSAVDEGQFTPLTEERAAISAMTDDGSTIDVMVLYTSKARAALGGEAAMALEIEEAVSLANQAYSNSGISQRLRLVHSAEVGYNETGSISVDLARISSKVDGYLDEIHAWRDQYGADLVALLVQSSDNDAAGIAWLLEVLDSVRYESVGFSVSDICCATGGLVFAHELGHNMGATHDWFVDDQPGLFDYSHGYVEPGCNFKTIMAYGNECPWFDPISYFSNPNLTYQGKAIGVQPGSSISCNVGNPNNPACDADNRLTLNNSASTVANFRQSVTQQPTATATTTPTPTSTATNTPVDTPTSTATSTPTGTLLATLTPSQTPTPTATGTPDAAATPFPTCTPTITPTTVPTTEPIPETEPRLDIADGVTTGAPGSYFTIQGSHFPPTITLTLTINGQTLTDVTTDGEGVFAVGVLTLATTKAGFYRVTLEQDDTVAVTFAIDPAAPRREAPVSGQSVTLPADLEPLTQLYLPLVQAGGASAAAVPNGTAPCN